MKNSALFRPDQYSYLLYPNKQLPKFLEKNKIPKEAVKSSKLFTAMLKVGDKSLLEQDVKGEYHFNGKFKNAVDLNKALDILEETKFAPLVKEEKKTF